MCKVISVVIATHKRISNNNYTMSLLISADCSVLCVETDNADGHYVCDNDGNRVCLDGYTNASSDCTECVPPTGCCELISSYGPLSE